MIERSYAKAVEVARHCNYWMTQNTKDNELAPYFNLMCASLATVSDLTAIEEQIGVVDSIYHANDKSTKALEYIRSVEEHYRQCIAYILELNESNQSRFLLIANYLGVKEEIITNIYSYFSNASTDLKPMITSYQQIVSILSDFIKVVWKKLVVELVIPGKYTKVTENAEESSTEVED